jgi:hypothetical protein
MHIFLRTLFVGAILTVGAAGEVSAATADPVVGTWTLNLDKSKFNPGPAPKSQTRVYAQTADGISMKVTGTSADGSAISAESNYKYDGKDYPITGAPNYDTLALKRVNGSTVKSTQKLKGKIVGTTTRTVSGHGKVLTLTSKGTNVKGVPFNDVSVFDKQ